MTLWLSSGEINIDLCTFCSTCTPRNTVNVRTAGSKPNEPFAIRLSVDLACRYAAKMTVMADLNHPKDVAAAQIRGQFQTEQISCLLFHIRRSFQSWGRNGSWDRWCS